MGKIPDDTGTNNADDLSLMDYAGAIWADIYWDALEGRELPREALRAGWGATTSQRYARHHARAIFAYTLYRLVPELTARLISDEALQLLERTICNSLETITYHTDCLKAPEEHGKGTFSLMFERHEYVEIKREAEDCRRATKALVEAWQSEYQLLDSWLAEAAERTTMTALIFKELGHEYGGVLAAYDSDATPYDGLLPEPDTTDPIPERIPVEIGSHVVDVRPARNGRVAYGISWEEFTSPEYNAPSSVVADCGNGFGYFDPRFETVDDAVSRIMPDLEARLRRVLADVKATDVEDKNAIEPRSFRKPTAFEWLVRFQVLGESRGDIARSLVDARKARDPEWEGDVKDYHSHVGREIRRVAELVDLKLRDDKTA